MSVVINGTTGITNPNSMTIGNGGGSIATNTAVGTSALAANTTGASSVAIGSGALQANTTASNNTAVGYQAGYANTTGAITAVGYFAGKSNTTATNNTAIGTVASYLTTTGGDNTSLGYGALYLNSTGGSNTAIGSQALLNTTASHNVAVGYQAGYSNQTGEYSTFVGEGAGYASVVTTTASNTFIGAYSGSSITTGAKNTIIGRYSGNQGGLDIRTANNYIVLSDGDGNPRLFWDGSTWKIGVSGFAVGSNTLAFSGDQYFYTCDAGGQSSAGTGIGVSKRGSTGRSINAAGTINASGADYAEYMTKAGDFTVAKGDVVGINAEGKLTNVFADAVSFAVKSTDPSYVGGDTWGVKSTDKDGEQYTEEELEAERQKVDRIAFAGQVPVNVAGATAGQYIIPVNDNGSIKGEAVSNPTFEQYQQAVGKVIAIEQDGRARIIVKVA